MPRVFLALIALAVFGARTDAGLRCVPPSVDFGEIRGGPVRQHRFELVNDGKATIEIIELPRSCGCLEPKLDRRTLQPGEKAGLLVELRTSGQPNGLRSWNLRVRYRDGEVVREELLILTATIHNEVTVQPSILALEVRDTLRQEVVVTDIRAKPLKVLALQASNPAIRAAVQSQTGNVTKVVLEVKASDLKAGRQDAMLNIITDDPLYSPLQLPIALTRAEQAAVTVTPPQVRLTVSADAPVASSLVRLRPAEGQKVAIASVESDDPGITCSWAAGPGDGATIKVQVDARRLKLADGPHSVRVQLDHPANQLVTIPVGIEKLP
jgi:hypothetical protein